MRGYRVKEVDVCILHKNMVWISPKLFNRRFIYGLNEEELRGRRMVEIFGLICHSRIFVLQEVDLICISRFADG